MMSATTLLTAVGDPTDPRVFGGTPYYLLAAGARVGVITGHVPLRVKDLSAARAVWNGAKIIQSGRWGGFQYSKWFLEKLWAKQEIREGTRIINLFQLYPDSACVKEVFRRYYYLDQTLHQQFLYYGEIDRIGKAYAMSVIGREKSQYAGAYGIIVTSRWARDSLVNYYGVNAEKIAVIPRGANVPYELQKRWIARPKVEVDGDSPLRLLFVGKEWRRKGLDRLVAAVRVARGQGARLQLDIVGPTDADLGELKLAPSEATVHGYIDKSKELRKYAELVERSHLGCLLSRAEAGGISLREFHLAGLPVMAPRTGGVSDFALEGGAVFVEPNATPIQIGQALMDLERDRKSLNRQAGVCFRHKSKMTWDHAIGDIGEFMRQA